MTDNIIEIVNKWSKTKKDMFISLKSYIKENNKIYTKDVKDAKDIKEKSWYSYVGQETTRKIGTYHNREQAGEGNAYFEFTIDVNAFYELIEK